MCMSIATELQLHPHVQLQPHMPLDRTRKLSMVDDCLQGQLHPEPHTDM